MWPEVRNKRIVRYTRRASGKEKNRCSAGVSYAIKDTPSRNGGFEIKTAVLCLSEGLVNCALFMGHGGVKGGRCRVLLYLSFKTA